MSAVDRAGGLPAGVARSVEAVAFWSAVAIPFLCLSLLAAGLTTSTRAAALLALLAANLVAVVLGRGHRRGSATSRR